MVKIARERIFVPLMYSVRDQLSVIVLDAAFSLSGSSLQATEIKENQETLDTFGRVREDIADTLIGR